MRAEQGNSKVSCLLCNVENAQDSGELCGMGRLHTLLRVASIECLQTLVPETDDHSINVSRIASRYNHEGDHPARPATYEPRQTPNVEKESLQRVVGYAYALNFMHANCGMPLAIFWGKEAWPIQHCVVVHGSASHSR